MTSLRQLEANRRNARLSTGPVTEGGKKQSRKNAVRHGLAAETVIGALEDAEDYAAFELAVTSDYDAQSAVERELVLRLASLLWRLRRATAIESGLFEIEAKQLLRLANPREANKPAAEANKPAATILETLWSNAADRLSGRSAGSADKSDARGAHYFAAAEANDLTGAFLGLVQLPGCPLDRLGRYQATLWRQARQTLLSLQIIRRYKMWERYR